MALTLAQIVARLPRGFHRRLLRVSGATGDEPEQVLTKGLRSEEIRSGLVDDPEFRREVVSDFHRDIAVKTAEGLGEVGRLVRSRRAAAGKYARAAGLTIADYLADKAKTAGMTVKQYLERPK